MNKLIRPTLFTFLALVICTAVNAQTPNYATVLIPEALKKNAHVVKRNETIEFEVKNINKAYYKVSSVVTVLDETAKNELFFYEFSDKFHSLESVKIEVFDALGISQKKYNKSDLTKQATGEGLVPDGNVYFLNIPVTYFPVTVKFEYEIKYNGILNYPGFNIQSPDESVEKTTFIATVPIELDLRFKPKNININPSVTNDNKVKTYTWTAEKLPAFTYEAGSAISGSNYPQVLIAPNKFELDGYEGDMSSWQNFGKWYASLAKESLNLSDESKQYLKNLVKDANTEKEKIKIIYQYLQNNFRYVSIQLGIGGFKPFEANFVDKKKYGDCKALSNYTQACLAAIGIKSYQALINASYNQEPVDPNFSINRFNHVIVCVPQPKDSIWLECTSPTNDFAVLGSFTENRNALLITENGGQLVATPKSKAEENTYTSNTIIELNADGSGKATTKLFTTGEYKQKVINYLNNQKKDDQKRYLVERLGFITPDDFSIVTNKQGDVTIVSENEKFYEFSAGKKLFFNPRLYKIWSNALPKAENRTQDFYFEHPFIKTDTTVYKLAPQLTIETLPKNKVLNFEFGSYTLTYQYLEKENKVITIAKLKLSQHKIDAAKFAGTKSFFDEVLAEYNEKIVLKKL
ncbi:MAG: transglutaminase domain-containing protein [Chitinophagaceae bacterium]|nr:transglutaminase domain-containing protein [Chitinophagaceae bacterium]